MEKFIPYEKLSKKEKRKIDQARRQTWGKLNPVTRNPENSKAYNRNKARNWKREYHETNSGYFLPHKDCKVLPALRNILLLAEDFNGCRHEQRSTLTIPICISPKLCIIRLAFEPIE